jgi:pimeloyl-ACP methyl ester carboxylesterase
MKTPVRIGLAVVLGLVVVLPLNVMAQDGEAICNDELLAAAQTAFDASSDLEDQARVDKLKEAYWLAAQGEALCVADLDRFHTIQFLRRRASARLGTVSVEPGEIDMGDFGLFMVCMGEGSPTVIFENGLGVDAKNSWQDIQPAISSVTRTCRYDRRNVGRSLFSAPLKNDAVRTIQDQVDDLARLLATAEIEPPYVLVGHSWGGLINLLFNDQYPEWVQGVVLTDASHPRQLETIVLVNAPTACDGPQSDRTTANPERLDFCDDPAYVGHISSIGDRPLAVVTAAQPLPDMPQDDHELWLELQTDYVGFSTNSRHIILENSHHFFQIGDELNLVIDAILWVINEAHAEE